MQTRIGRSRGSVEFPFGNPRGSTVRPCMMPAF